MHRRPFVSFVATALLLFLNARGARAESFTSPPRFGLGLELGAPSGLTAKYFLGGNVAVQGGAGVIESWGEDGLHMHAEVVWHPALLHKGPAVSVPLHVGVGGRFLQHQYDGRDCFDGRVYYYCDEDTHLGVRAPVGVSFLFRKTPLDVFVELALVVDFVFLDDNDRYYHDHDHAGINGVMGARYYF